LDIIFKQYIDWEIDILVGVTPCQELNQLVLTEELHQLAGNAMATRAIAVVISAALGLTSPLKMMAELM